MKTTLITLLTITLLACGTDEGSNKSSDKIDKTTARETSEGALAINSKDGIGECSEANQNQLVYVISESKFYTCNQSNWAYIDIKGEDGSDGQDGSKGQNGRDGSNGSMMVQDPVTGEPWLFAGFVLHGTASNPRVDAKFQCMPKNTSSRIGHYRLAERSEVISAADNGTFEGLSGFIVLEFDDASTFEYMDLENHSDTRFSQDGVAGKIAHAMLFCKFDPNT